MLADGAALADGVALADGWEAGLDEVAGEAAGDCDEHAVARTSAQSSTPTAPRPRANFRDRRSVRVIGKEVPLLAVGSAGRPPPCPSLLRTAAAHHRRTARRLIWASLSRYPTAVNRSELIKAGGPPGYSITANA
jgi:hypothetical protein